MPDSRPNCRWWESTVLGEASFFAECRDLGYGSPLAGVFAEVASALNRDLDASYCPWCGHEIEWCDESEVRLPPVAHVGEVGEVEVWG